MAIKRNAIFITIIGLIIILIVSIVCYFNFPLFRLEETPMAQIELKGRKININFIQSGATTQDVVQVTIKKGNVDKVISNIPRMNFLIGYQFIDDTTLLLNLKDTVFASNKSHIFRINLSK